MPYTPPPLSRSISSSTLRNHCQKKYYFNYYTNWLKKTNADLRLETLLLKNIASYKMWIGTHTHFILSDYLQALKTGPLDPSSLKRITDLSAQVMSQEFDFSATRQYETYDKNQKFGLNEHAYNKELPSEPLQEAIRIVTSNLEAFRSSALHEDISTYIRDGHRVFIEDKEPNFEQMKVVLDHVPELSGVNIRAQPDAGVVTKDGRYIIYDRKSGTIRDERRKNPLSEQLKVYALKLLTRTKKNIEDISIEGYEIYVPSMEIFGGEIQDIHIQGISDKIISDVTTISDYLHENDVSTNKPLAVEKFLRTDDTKKCDTCRFKRVCDKLKTFESHTLF